MTDIVIKAENIGKKYVIGHQVERGSYTALRDVLVHNARTLWNKTKDMAMGKPIIQGDTMEEVWALKDVSFEIRRGEAVGIIGRNGAGKSTLLKILSRITEPSTGRVTIKGGVASLLEIGTGFHPELSGRENIYLNGTILGMTRAEIKHKFDEIVAFAEVEKYLDTPVKRYSSGMYVRLAFAVAAHLEPEILVVDEVLAVGDAAFQKKCLGKMGDVAKEGRTVLFVSHNMQAILQLCDRAILLQTGSVAIDEKASNTVEYYLQEENKQSTYTKNLEDIIKNLPYDPVFNLDNIELLQGGQKVGLMVENGKPLEVKIAYRVLERSTGLRVYFDLCDDQDTLLFRSFHDEDNDGIPITESGNYVAHSFIPANLLAPIKYELRIKSGIFNVRYCLPPQGISIPIDVEHTGSYNRAYLSDTFRGKLAPIISWKVERIISHNE